MASDFALGEGTMTLQIEDPQGIRGFAQLRSSPLTRCQSIRIDQKQVIFHYAAFEGETGHGGEGRRPRRRHGARGLGNSRLGNNGLGNNGLGNSGLRHGRRRRVVDDSAAAPRCDAQGTEARSFFRA
jgi:hypothetical protein